MATAKSKAQIPIGSAKWVLDEREHAVQFVNQEVEEFSFSARNEMEWLNEHMAEIFNQAQFDVAEVFKTPGKLRGKTPRTAKKRDVEIRAPLTDVFSPNIQNANSPSRNTPFYKQVAQFQVAEDKENHTISQKTASRFSEGAGKENVDSGYHDSTQDDVEMEKTKIKPAYKSPVKQALTTIPTYSPARFLSPTRTDLRDQRTQSVESFVSAKEAQPTKQISASAAMQEVENSSKLEDVVQADSIHESAASPKNPSRNTSRPYSISAETASDLNEALANTENSPSTREENVDQTSPTSEDSSPERPTIRKKSSLTFAALPAREPLTGNKSFGNRISRTSHFDSSKGPATGADTNMVRNSTIVNTVEKEQVNLVGLSAHDNDDDVDVDMKDDEQSTIIPESSEATKLHNKTSTQRLHAQISMLGKSSTIRPSKSIPLAVARTSTNVSNGQAPTALKDVFIKPTHDDNDDDWIGPINPSFPTEDRHPVVNDVERPATDKEENVSQDSAGKEAYKESFEVEWSTNAADHEMGHAHNASTTPVGSPVRERGFDGPLSASKAKLYSVLKSAKGIFASSASSSAQAKMESLFSNHSQPQLAGPTASMRQAGSQAEDMDPTQSLYPHSASEQSQDANLEGAVKRKSSARLRNRQDEAQSAGMNNATENENVNKKDTQKPPTIIPVGQDSLAAQDGSDAEIGTAAVDKDGDLDMPPPPPPKPSQGKHGEPRRPARPAKDAPPKTKPAPVSIRVASQRAVQVGPSSQSFNSSVSEATSQQANTKKPMLSKKTSNSSLNTTSSSQSFKTAASTTSRPKALEAAARKKEQEEREAQRRAEHKRDIERKRAAKVEEEKRLAQEAKATEQAKAVEQQRAAEARNAAQRQAAEQRKADAIRRNEELRSQAQPVRIKQSEDVSKALQDERSHTHSQTQRSELGVAPRPASSAGGAAGELNRPTLPHVNPAKPPKRYFQPDEDEQQRAAPPQSSVHHGTQQQQAKRMRMSEDEDSAEQTKRPTMAPPIRLSNMRRDGPPKYGQHYGNASQSMLKTAVTAQHHAQYPKTPNLNDMAKYSTAKIPFAEAPNPPQASSQSSQLPQTIRLQPHSAKTPGTAGTKGNKSSPLYPNGENIELPEIASDSEDDSDNEFQAPEWANSPELRELLRQQQLVDPMKVFGPIAPLAMEEVFRGNKERQAKFRARTSSANWNGPDRLTEEERRRDWEARERLEKDGAWTYTGGI